jgi:hypothetical protein
MNIGYMLWLGAGVLGAYILNRNPSKLVFGRNFQGSMIRSALSVIVLVGVISGPVLLVLALLLPAKKLCPSCYAAVLQTETICPNCSAYVPEIQPESKTAKEELTESKLSHFSPEIQAAVKKGYEDISMVSLFLLIGPILMSLVLGVFIMNESDAGGVLICASMPLGFILAWLWWSYSVPRWREWALKQPGVNPEELQKAAEVVTLVWPKGHFFEKTELKLRKK